MFKLIFKPKPRFNLLLAGVFVLAVLLRLYKLSVLPPSIFIDEYNLFFDALKITLQEAHPVWYGIGWYGTPELAILFFSWLIKIFGTSWFSFKLAWGVPAILLLPLVYKLGKNLFDRSSGFWAFLLLTLSATHIHLSRWAHVAIIITTTNSLSALLWYLGVSKNKLYLTALSAGCFALSLYTYVGARSFLVFFGLVFLYLWLVGIKQHSFKLAFQHTAVFSLVLIIAVWPNLQYGRTHQTEMWARTRELSLLRPELAPSVNWQRLKANLGLYTAMIVAGRPDPNLRHDPLQQPVIPFPLFWLSLSGLILLVWQKKWRPTCFLFSLTVASLIGGILSIEAPSIFRTNLVLVPISLLAGHTLAQVSRPVILAKKRRWLAGFWLALLLVLAVGGSVKQLYQYFALTDQPSIGLLEAFSSFESRIADQTLTELEMNKAVYLSADFFWFSSTQYQVKSKQAANQVHLFEPTQDLRTWSGASLILDPAFKSLIDYLAIAYPDLQLQTITTRVGRQFLLVRVPAVDPVPHNQVGLTRTCQSSDGQQKTTQVDPTIFVSWGDHKPTESDTFNCIWTGWFQPPQAGMYTFSTVADDAISLQLLDDKQKLIDLPLAPSGQVTLPLRAQSYHLRASYDNKGGATGAYVYVKSDRDTQQIALPPAWLKP